jgi:hypothetical protein
LCHFPEDVLEIAVEPGAGRFIIIVRCHNLTQTWSAVRPRRR